MPEDKKAGSIFLHPNPIPVYWGTFSVLSTDLMCMREFLKRVIFRT